MLTSLSVKVWYDEYSLKIGDRLRASIDRGLANCQFGVVVLSPAFFAKNWTEYELDGCCRRLRFDPDAEIHVNRPDVDRILEWAAFASSLPGSSARRQPVHFGVGGNRLTSLLLVLALIASLARL
jgi:hypothetical protein